MKRRQQCVDIAEKEHRYRRFTAIEQCFRLPPQAEALGLGTFPGGFLGSCSVDHGLKFSPSFPEDQPPGVAVMFSVHVAA
ncbi:MAG: hypothetical protein NT138_10790, partial [Planctomycetales bacterium]|nr:hypothetical protein [Planctomycetales bacterium]